MSHSTGHRALLARPLGGQVDDTPASGIVDAPSCRALHLLTVSLIAWSGRVRAWCGERSACTDLVWFKYCTIQGESFKLVACTLIAALALVCYCLHWHMCPLSLPLVRIRVPLCGGLIKMLHTLAN